MAGGKQNWYAELVVVRSLLDTGHPAIPAWNQHFIALSTLVHDPTAGTGAANPEVVPGEVTGGGYERATVGNEGFSGPGGIGNRSNNATITFPAATADWGVIRSFYLIGWRNTDSMQGLICGSDFPAPITIATGTTPSFAAGALVFLET
jgi:hypothetical protein